MTQITGTDLSTAAQNVVEARTAYHAAADTELQHKLALAQQENAVVALSKGEEGALTGSSAEARAAQLAGMFSEDRAALREAERGTRAARLALENAETLLTGLRYQVRLLEVTAAASR